MDKIKLAQRKLAKALRALDPDVGRVARRNARARVFAAIKSLEHAINADVPLEPKVRKQANKALRACSERMTAVGFRREIRKIAPQAWNQTEAQLFANWILDQHGIAVRPIVLRADRVVARMLESEMEIPAPPEWPISERYVRLWELLGAVLARRYATYKASERAIVRRTFQVVQAWGATEWREHLAEPAETSPPILELRAG